MERQERRLHRQFEALGRAAPPARGLLARLLSPRLRIVRILSAIVLILGGLAGVLPLLGFWMLPLGLLLLAVDLPALRPAVLAASIRGRRYLQLRRRAWFGPSAENASPRPDGSAEAESSRSGGAPNDASEDPSDDVGR